MLKHLNLRTKLFLITACTILIPLSTFSFFAYRTASKSVIAAFRDEQISTVKKAGVTTDNVLSEIEKTSLLVITNSHLREYLDREPSVESKWNAYSLLAYLKNTSGVIRSLHLIGNDERILTLGENSATVSQQDRETANLYNGAAFWARERSPAGQGIYMCRLIRNVTLPTEHLGYIKIYIDLPSLSERLYHDGGSSMDYYILDGDGTILYTTVSDPREPLPPVQSLRQYSMSCRLDWVYNRSFSVYPLSNTGLLLVGISNLDTIRQQNRANALLYAGISLSCFVFCLLLAMFLSRKTLRPLTQLISHMRQIEQMNFDTRIQISGDPEIEGVARQFNSMAETIQSLIAEVYSVSIKRKEAELRALQTQIKPHFLYNTLDLAYWTAQAETAPMTAELINSLSQFFRRGLISESEFTTLDNELEHLRYYILLQRQHNPDFDFELEAPRELRSCKVVRLILQPLVENAFLHGISDRKDGRIEVRVYRRGEVLNYDIMDNGTGIEEGAVEKLLHNASPENNSGSGGIGLKNVHDRIQLAFGASYGISAKNLEHGGACVHVEQPYTHQDGQGDYDD